MQADTTYEVQWDGSKDGPRRGHLTVPWDTVREAPVLTSPCLPSGAKKAREQYGQLTRAILEVVAERPGCRSGDVIKALAGRRRGTGSVCTRLDEMARTGQLRRETVPDDRRGTVYQYWPADDGEDA